MKTYSKIQTNNTTYKQCTRCVMDTSDMEITFDENGYCNHCSNYFKNIKPIIDSRIKNNELEKIINIIKQKGKNKPYDCIVGISGGFDSSYTAYLLKKYGLRILAVNMDNGWNKEISVENIRLILEKLNIDFESYTLDWNQFKNIQLSFLKASVPEIETPTDIAILSVLHKIAAKYNVKYIVLGNNFASEGILPYTWHYNSKDLKYFKSIHKQFGRVSLKHFPLFGFWEEAYYKFIKNIKIIYLLNYIQYDKQMIKEFLISEFKLKDYKYKHHESQITDFIQSYVLPTKFNIDYRKATYSSLICSGNMKREEAIELLKNKPYSEEQITEKFNYIAKKLDLHPDELKEILNQPPKWYFDYPNNSRILNLMYYLYRKFF